MGFLTIILAVLSTLVFTITADYCRGNRYPLGISANIKTIPDSAITASSNYANRANHWSYHGRLHEQVSHGCAGTWVAGYQDVNQYLQIDLSKDHVITGTATQGSIYDQWVKSYQLQYLTDGSGIWRYYQISGAPKIFQGNSDRSTVVKHDLKNPFTARFVRFRPQTWYSFISLRVELYSCDIKATSPTISTFCLSDHFGVSIKKDISSFASVTLKDPSCIAGSNATHITLSTSFSECATSKNETKDHIVVSNEIRMLGAASGIITRANTTIIPFECKYSRSDLKVSLSSFQPKVKSFVQSQESGFGNFTLSFRMARSASFGSYFDTYPVAAQINDRLYFQISLNANNTDTVLLIERCDATPTLNKNAATKYNLIDNRCPTDNTMQFHSGAIHHKKFSFLAFNFIHNVSTIYMHCEVYLCHQTSQDSRCTSGCGINKVSPSLRKKRDINKREIHGGSSKIYVVENGPIQKSKQKQGASSSNMATGLIAMCVAVVVLSLILVGIFIVKLRKRVLRKALKKTDNSNDNKGSDNKAMDGCV